MTADGPTPSSGGAVELLEELALAARVQGSLERVYGLERIADVKDFVRPAAAGEREALLLRRGADGSVEMRVELPQAAGKNRLDALCQIIEGVSHFVYVAERTRVDRSATQLELEVQAEVDKWVVLAGAMPSLDAERSAVLRYRLYECVRFSHGDESEVGRRYRVANDVAHGFVRRLESRYLACGPRGEWRERVVELRAALRRFFHVGQEEKLRLGRAA